MKRFYLLLLFTMPGFWLIGQPQKSFEIFLIGDAGLTSSANASYKQVLNEQLASGTVPATIIFLGDNIYPKGMHLPDEPLRPADEAVMLAQLQLIKQHTGSVYFIPGNHDWKQGKPDGWKYILQQAAWVDSLHNPRIKFLPQGGCPGPEEISLTDQLTLVLIDSQWFLHPWQKPQGENSACEAKTAEAFFIQLEDVLHRNRNKRVIIAAHHPVFTYSEHGGVSTVKNHLFPLTNVNKNLYLPLPGVGSVYPLYRKVFGNIQDVAHPQYKQFARLMRQVLEKYPGTLYASGHDHALQYIQKDSIHFIVSGSGSKTTPVKKKGYARYVAAENGFVKVTFYADGSSDVIYYTDAGEQFKTRGGKVAVVEEPPVTQNQAASVRSLGSMQYTVGKNHERLLGKNYRAEWATEIDVPVLDLTKEHGGLRILQLGGGMQTLSLRLADSAGREYTLRSIEKYPEKAVPEILRKTFALDLVQDQISAAHPYGALIVPPLAKAAGIYHTNPKLVYLPDAAYLGDYRSKFANHLMLYEERPAGSANTINSFGNAKKIISTDKVLAKLLEDNDNIVDQAFVLRNRIFDLWIGDWDRHDDQWRWAEFEEKKTRIYRPIPRDRDQAFFVNEGLIPKIWSRKWAMPKFQGFDDELNWPPGFMYNARYFDRSFLTALPKEVWVQTAEDLTSRLTDEVIEASINEWPAEIAALHGQEIIRKLKSRRARLVQYALQHYLFLAKEVDVVGTDKNERIEINRFPNDNVQVDMYKLNKLKEKSALLYSRLFIAEETSEIRIYGLGGNDEVIIAGSASKGMKVRVIGGDGNDTVDNQTNTRAGNLLYDTPTGIMASGKWKNKTSVMPEVNEYNRRAFQYNRVAPLLYGNFNIDDGLFFGGGFLATHYGFRKNPYKTQHLFLGSYAINTGSYNFKYDGRFTEVVGKWNLELDVDIKAPNFVNNFFGLGNETVFDKTIDDLPGSELDHAIEYYRLRFREYLAEVRIAHKLGAWGFVKGGAVYQHVQVEEPTDPEDGPRFIQEYEQQTSERIIDVKQDYAGATFSWGFDRRDNPRLTTRGVFFQQNNKVMTGLGNSNGTFSAVNASMALYQSFRIPAVVTYAVRVGGGINTGNYQFYQAQILDGKTELRGYRKTRFYGDKELFVNNEVRFRLGSFKSYLFPASYGVLGFYDLGRVWYKDASGKDPSALNGQSVRWHQGVGGGVWFTPFNLTALSVEVGRSRETVMAYVRLGFLF
ncbi:MAG: BamA/TamA family outer membrane protein [Cyclobacteriaceae bacterium]|nr:BamA/TamA family outer membrane protein [Cyclobacteriaceae bacterium]